MKQINEKETAELIAELRTASKMVSFERRQALEAILERIESGAPILRRKYLGNYTQDDDCPQIAEVVKPFWSKKAFRYSTNNNGDAYEFEMYYWGTWTGMKDKDERQIYCYITEDKQTLFIENYTGGNVYRFAYSCLTPPNVGEFYYMTPSQRASA